MILDGHRRALQQSWNVCSQQWAGGSSGTRRTPTTTFPCQSQELEDPRKWLLPTLTPSDVLWPRTQHSQWGWSVLPTILFIIWHYALSIRSFWKCWSLLLACVPRSPDSTTECETIGMIFRRKSDTSVFPSVIHDICRRINQFSWLKFSSLALWMANGWTYLWR